MTSGIITISNIRLYAFHGCLKEEALIGGEYIVDVRIYTDYSLAAKTDDLTKTVDYCEVYEIVKKEMKIRSKLIEHASQRIANSLKKKISKIEKVKVRLTKLSPPVNGDVGSVSVISVG
jgi:7,8-dihydroneopterin aldolase/epimerase/oxygenase